MVVLAEALELCVAFRETGRDVGRRGAAGGWELSVEEAEEFTACPVPVEKRLRRRLVVVECVILGYRPELGYRSEVGATIPRE